LRQGTASSFKLRREALPTSEEAARKERNRVNQRRYRARKKAGIASPMACFPTRRSRPEAVLDQDPFAAIDDLALDFLEAEEVIEPECFEHLPSR